MKQRKTIIGNADSRMSEAYEAPQVEIIEVAVEKGYAESEYSVQGYSSDSDDYEL